MLSPSGLSRDTTLKFIVTSFIMAIGQCNIETFLFNLKRSARPSKASGLAVDVFSVHSDQETFIREHLDELRESGQGIFSRLKHQKGDYCEYQCERNNKPRGRSSGVSTKTRANRCTAFVSFK